jgi:cytochrome d ubiquinol oxidase subunit II
MNEAHWLPVIFMGLMGLAMLIYVVLDGYDLGVGILFSGTDEDRDRMVASIGPFWDANETWLVLGIGILLTAFPKAHGEVLTALYLPVAAMLAGLILRGVAFDFRVKAQAHHKAWWNRAFRGGSLLASLSQGWMLGAWITGFRSDALGLGFAAAIALGLPAGYALLGACWLVLKTEGALQQRAIKWARMCLWLTALGVVAVSAATPLVSARIFDKWFTLPNLLLLAPIPLVTAALFVLADVFLRRLARDAGIGDAAALARWPCWHWAPFACAAGIFVLAFCGLAYSMFPYLVVDRMDIWQAASAPQALKVILAGAVVVLPAILAYTAYSYWVFRGKARDLAYD